MREGELESGEESTMRKRANAPLPGARFRATLSSIAERTLRLCLNTLDSNSQSARLTLCSNFVFVVVLAAFDRKQHYHFLHQKLDC